MELRMVVWMAASKVVTMAGMMVGMRVGHSVGKKDEMWGGPMAGWSVGY